ncbi:MAG: hypothetical protein DVB23_002973 [Verrucomicrobia bacterium]|nr:MAG: hypothetical protein DVB23_002973 [Verrucomicrobiota bacterium]
MPPAPRILALLAATLAALLAFPANAPSADPIPRTPKLLWQPVLDAGAVPHPGPATSLNPFVSYTHLGTDFGFHGPAEHQLVWDNGRISADLTGQDAWVGMWHSLAGLAASASESLDFAAPYPAPIRAASQPKITSLAVRATGNGTLKIEIKSPGEDLLWQQAIPLQPPGSTPVTIPLDPESLRRAKLLVWTAEPGSKVSLAGVALGVETRPLPIAELALSASFAKLALCYSQGTGLVRDRAHVPHGAFDSIPASGLFALATAAVSTPEIALVEPTDARRVLHEVVNALDGIQKAAGLLPHFVREINGRHVIHPRTEYSTVDTAIAYQGLLLAAEILDDDEVRLQILQAIQAIDFPLLTLADGTISHGLREDGTTVIPYSWRDWGGESALVILLRGMAESSPPTPVMAGTGHPWQGTGFIAEIQSLFHPDFDSPQTDAVSGVDWLQARRSLLEKQKRYWPVHAPESMAAKLGLYGLSASESVSGTTYQVNGVDLTKQDSLQPHYMLMAAAIDPDPTSVRTSLQHLLAQGWLAPWGTVETFAADGRHYLPMIGSLNAGFEALGAYHFLTGSKNLPNAIHEASRSLTEVRSAMRAFYP